MAEEIREKSKSESKPLQITSNDAQSENFSVLGDIIDNITPTKIEDDERKKIDTFAKENNIPYVETIKFNTLDQMKKYFFAEKTKRRNDLIKSARVPKIFNNTRAKDFIITDNNESTAQTAIKAITDNNGLFIYGECGTGKTMLASIIANERAELFKSSMFIGAVDIFHELNPYSSDSRTAATRKALIKNAPCLIIDDLGAEKPSDWTKQTLFEIIDYRYRENLQTIITSNFNINELNSRLSEYEGKRIIRRIKAICNLIELNHY